jgi:hypothetical protein
MDAAQYPDMGASAQPTQQQVAQMGGATGQPQTPWSSYEAPPEVGERNDSWMWIAAALDALFNDGAGAGQYIAQMARPDTSHQDNWERRNKAMNDASSREAQMARQQPGNNLALMRFQEEQQRREAMNSLDSPETMQWREAAIASGIVTPEVADKMSAQQLIALRPQLGQQVSQQKSFENSSAGRVQSHKLSVQRQLLASKLADGRIEYQDFLQQMRAIDAQDVEDEERAIASAPDNPKLVQEESKAYGQELRLRGLDDLDAKLTTVENLLAQYPEGADIPGYGPIDGLKPDATIGEEGRAIRRAVRELQDAKLRAATGAAAPPSEQTTFASILGTGTFNTEGDLRGGIGQARGVVERQKGYLNEMFPSARQAGGVARPQQRSSRRATPRSRAAMDEDLPDDNLGTAPVPRIPAGARKPPKAVQPGARTKSSEWEF